MRLAFWDLVFHMTLLMNHYVLSEKNKALPHSSWSQPPVLSRPRPLHLVPLYIAETKINFIYFSTFAVDPLSNCPLKAIKDAIDAFQEDVEVAVDWCTGLYDVQVTYAQQV